MNQLSTTRKRPGRPKKERSKPVPQKPTSEMDGEEFAPRTFFGEMELPEITSFLELDEAEELRELFRGNPEPPYLIKLLGCSLASQAKWQKYLRLTDAILELVKERLSAYGPIPNWMLATNGDTSR